MMSIETVDGGSDVEYLKGVVGKKLGPAARQILQTGAAPFVLKPPTRKGGKSPDETPEERKTRMATALETYNSEDEHFSRFPYPSGYASLSSGKRKDFHFEGVFTPNTPTTGTQEAVFAMLAARQALVGSQFNYPMTFFVGPNGRLPEEKRRERFSRVAFGNLGTGLPYTVMVTFTHSYPRRAHAVVWIPGSEEGPVKDSAGIGNTVVNSWKKKGGKEFANDAILKSGSVNEFIRSTGSEEAHSVLWPIIKLSMTTDESKLYAPLWTKAALSEEEMGETGFGKGSRWHQWTMGLLAYGSIPYKKHSTADPDPWYGKHMTRDTLDTLAKTVQISSKEA
jgi:hypothetical protein